MDSGELDDIQDAIKEILSGRQDNSFLPERPTKKTVLGVTDFTPMPTLYIEDIPDSTELFNQYLVTITEGETTIPPTPTDHSTLHPVRSRPMPVRSTVRGPERSTLNTAEMLMSSSTLGPGLPDHVLTVAPYTDTQVIPTFLLPDKFQAYSDGYSFETFQYNSATMGSGARTLEETKESFNKERYTTTQRIDEQKNMRKQDVGQDGTQDVRQYGEQDGRSVMHTTANTGDRLITNEIIREYDPKYWDYMGMYTIVTSTKRYITQTDSSNRGLQTDSLSLTTSTRSRQGSQSGRDGQDNKGDYLRQEETTQTDQTAEDSKTVEEEETVTEEQTAHDNTTLPVCRTTTPTTTTTTTTPPPHFDIAAFLSIIANLTYDYETNLTMQVNETLQKYRVPTCATPTTPTTTTTTSERPEYEGLNKTIIAKCFVCGLDTPGIPREANCADAFAGDFLPLVPQDPSAKGKIARFRKYCRYGDVFNYYVNVSQPRTIYGRWTGGCSVRWTDLTGVYTQRSCRNRQRATTGLHYASKRMAKLEMALSAFDSGCIVAPVATLLPLSRGISLYARFHACVCLGSWCNHAPRWDAGLMTLPLWLAGLTAALPI